MNAMQSFVLDCVNFWWPSPDTIKRRSLSSSTRNIASTHGWWKLHVQHQMLLPWKHSFDNQPSNYGRKHRTRPAFKCPTRAARSWLDVELCPSVLFCPADSLSHACVHFVVVVSGCCVDDVRRMSAMIWFDCGMQFDYNYYVNISLPVCSCAAAAKI